MSNDIQAPSPIGPNERKMYEQEYLQSANLFKQALGEYEKSTNIYQQREFKGVMDKAMQVLNETAKALKQKNLLTQNTKIAQDYASFQDKPTDPEIQEKLLQDLERAEKSIG